MMVVIVIRRLGEIGAFTSADRFVARCGAAPNEVHLVPQDLPTLYFGQPMPQPRHLHGDPHPNSLQQVTRVAAYYDRGRFRAPSEMRSTVSRVRRRTGLEI